MSSVNYSIVVPCYASGAWLGELVARTNHVMNAYGPFELILVNDKSPDDRTWAAIEDLANRFRSVRGIDLLDRVGQFRATLCGLDYATGQYVITMDDDLQHPPEELPRLIEAMKQNAAMDCIMGRYRKKQHGLIRNAGSRLLRAMMSCLYGKPATITTTSFRIMPASFAKSLCLCRAAATQLGPLIVTTTKRVMNVPVMHHRREHGKSGYTMLRCTQEMLRSVMDASTRLPRWLPIAGAAVAAVAMLSGLSCFLRWSMRGIGIAGHTALILASVLLCGVLLMGIGILAGHTSRAGWKRRGMPRCRVRVEVGGGHE